MLEILRRLLTEPTEVVETRDAATWWSLHLERRSAESPPIDRALLDGYRADRVAFAFAAGYHAALGALVPEGDPDRLAALCATEDGGAHPRAIRTTLSPDGAGDHRLSGTKRLATLATLARELLIVATTGHDDAGRPRLVLVRVPAERRGVAITRLPDFPFTPEIPHASVELCDVAVAAGEVLPGDGYARYLKPFRTIEDLHVHAALLGYLLRIARRDSWPAAELEHAGALIAATVALARAPASDPAVHVALAGLLAASREWVERTRGQWERAPSLERERFARDAPILGVAQQAREKRAAAAWRLLGDEASRAASTPGGSRAPTHPAGDPPPRDP